MQQSSRGGRHRPGRASLVSLACVGAITCGLAACGSDSDSSGGKQASSGGGSAAPSTVRIAVSSYTAPYAPLYAGIKKGFFAKNGIKLVIDQVGANTAAALASGRDDLVAAGVSTPFVLAQQGQDTQLITASYGGGVTGFLAAKPDVTSAAGCKTTATFTKGATTYAWSLALLKALGNTSSHLLSQTEFANIAKQLASGRADCATGTYDIFAPLMQAGKAHALLDPRTDKAKMPAPLRTMPEAGFFGLTKKLESRRDVIVRFLKGYRESVDYFKNTDPAQLAKETREADAGFQATPEATLAEALKVQRSFYAANGGMITPSQFNDLSNFIKSAGNDFVKGPKFAYDKLVNMSYLKAAQ